MLTFFTTAKAFQGHSAIIQRNALKSWTLIHPDIEVILFGDDEGAAQVCAEFGLRHEPHVERHESGMKRLDYMFARAQELARHSYLCYSNCDIVLMKDFRKAFEKAISWRNQFLLVAQRWDTDITEPIDFAKPSWDGELHHLALTTGHLQMPGFIDFFVFSKGLYDEVPPLVVGRSYWDHWLVWKALSEGSPVLDGSSVIVPIHQNHGYGYHPLGKQGTNEDPLAMRNFELAGNGQQLRSMRDATHCISRSGKIRRVLFRRQLGSDAALKLRQMLVEKTFTIRKRLGLRTETLDKIRGISPRSLD
jgi:hypothetical protein